MIAQLAELNGHEWLRLDELARRPYWSWRQSPLDDVADWEPVLAAGTSLVGLVAASMCRDGRVREAAVNALGRARAPLAAAALAIRVADWVPEVRSAAWVSVSARTGASDAAAIVPVMLALKPRVRGQEAAARYLAKVAYGPTVTVQALAIAGDRTCELWALDALKQRNLLTADVLVDRAMRDPDPVVALWCARSLADPSGELSTSASRRLLASARARVRAFAAGHLSDDQLTRQALQQSLLDRSASGLPPGGGGGGSTETPDRSTGRPWPTLADPAVAVVALRHLHGYALPVSVLASLSTVGTAGSRRIALSIQQHSGTWNRVQADLAAINGHDRDLADAARADLLAWLQHGAATSYGQPDADQAAEIARFLATSELSDKQRREIAFVAGIRVHASGAQPG